MRSTAVGQWRTAGTKRVGVDVSIHYNRTSLVVELRLKIIKSLLEYVYKIRKIVKIILNVIEIGKIFN